MLSEVCAEIKNYFTYERDKHFGDFSVVDGQLSPSFDLPTNYIRVVGSHLNDGVHKRDETGWGLVDEAKFHGAVWVMSPPKDFLALVSEIEAWQAVNGKADSLAMSPFYAESFGGYSYSKSAGSVGGSGTASSWQAVYGPRLKVYRRILI